MSPRIALTLAGTRAAHAMFLGLSTAVLLASTASGCGFSTHDLITHRAASAFYSGPFAALLADNSGSLEAGSPYPDYLYQCGANHDDGEYSHWSPFQYAAALYIRSTYSAPLNSSGAALVAFMFGVTSHYVADINWHGLAEVPSAQGMIETIGVLDFNTSGPGPAPAPHTLADTGGEFVAAYAVGLTWESPETWVIPVADLLAIYKSVNRTDVTASAIQECALEFAAGAEAVAALAALAAPYLVAPSPTFAESYIDLPLGGVDDMAVYAARLWGRWGEWVTRGPPNPPPGHEYCPGVCESGSAPPAPPSSGQAALKDAYRVLAPALLGAGLMEAEAREDAISIERREARAHRVPAVLSHLRALLAAGGKSAPSTARLTAGWTTPRAADVSPDAVAHSVLQVLRRGGAGGSITAMSREGDSPSILLLRFLDAAEAQWAAPPTVGRPKADIPTPNRTFSSVEALEYAGSAFSSGDFDHDGTLDVVVTAYGHTAMASDGALLPQSGAFYTRYGNVSARITASTESLPRAFPSLTEGTAAYTRLGWAACALDLNADGVDDLAVSAPSSGWAWDSDPWGQAPSYAFVGAVHVYFGGPAGLPSTPSLVILGQANNTHTGTHLECADANGDGFADAIIGSPLAVLDATDDTTTQAGRVDVFLAAAVYVGGGQVVPLSAAKYSVLGTGLGEWMGYSTAVLQNATDALALSSVEVVASLSTHAVPPQCARAAVAAAAADRSPTTVLFVGQPGYRAAIVNGGRTAVGRVSAFALPTAGTPADALASCLRRHGALSLAPVFTLTADAFLAKGPAISPKLGHGVAVGRPRGGAAAPVLAVGMTAVDFCNSSQLLPGNGTNAFNTSAGSVTLLSVVPTLRGDLMWADVTAAAAFDATVLGSTLPDSRLGWHLSLMDVSGDGIDDLTVGAPMYTPVFIGRGPHRSGASDSGHEAGLLLVFLGGAAFPFPGAPVGTAAPLTCSTATAASARLEGALQYGRFGSSWHVAALDGAATLLVGAPRAAEPWNGVSGVDMPGAVYAFAGPGGG